MKHSVFIDLLKVMMPSRISYLTVLHVWVLEEAG